MLAILKPLLMAMCKSRAFKELIVEMLERVAAQTDNDVDDLFCTHARNLLLPDTRIDH